MRMADTNSNKKTKLKYDDIRDLILVEEVCKRYFRDTLDSVMPLTLKLGAKDMIRTQRRASRNKGKSRTRFGQQSTC